jgi:proline iminopeptidase
MAGSLIDIGDTELFVEERGEGLPLIVLHGGPGLDHHMWGSLLDPLMDRCRLLLTDLRANGQSGRPDPATWTLERMAADVSALAAALDLDRYAVLGHSFGAMVAVQHAVDFSGQPVASIVSHGVPSERFLMSFVEQNLAAFEPLELRDRVMASWEREKSAQSAEEVLGLLRDQMPFHFADPLDPRLAQLDEILARGVYSPEVLRHFANEGYGGIEVEDRLGDVRHPTLVLAGRHDRTTSVAAAEAMASGIPHAELVVFEDAGHMSYVEDQAVYLRAVGDFLGRHGLL